MALNPKDCESFKVLLLFFPGIIWQQNFHTNNLSQLRHVCSSFKYMWVVWYLVLQAVKKREKLQSCLWVPTFFLSFSLLRKCNQTRFIATTSYANLSLKLFCEPRPGSQSVCWWCCCLELSRDSESSYCFVCYSILYFLIISFDSVEKPSGKLILFELFLCRLFTFFRIFRRSLDAGKESQENWAWVQNGRRDAPPPPPHHIRARCWCHFLLRWKNREAVNSLVVQLCVLLMSKAKKK